MKPDLPPLFRSLCTVRLHFEPGCESPGDFCLRLPTEAGVVFFEDKNGRCILIRGIGDPRAFVRRRLAPDPDDPPARTDYAAVTRTVSVIPTGSTLLAEVLSAGLHASVDSDGAEAAAAPLNAAFVLCDPTARLPSFREVGWRDLWSGATTPTSHERVLGPFQSPKRARRWVEGVVDLFDLCRYDHLLAQTPNATACVYKQMGKCPAPCDGSEPIESYRARFRRAAACTGSMRSEEARRCRERMERAAAGLAFEEAATLKERLEKIESLDSGGPWAVCDLRDTLWQCSGPTRRRDWVRHWALSLDGLALFADREGTGEASTEMFAERGAEILGDRTVWLLLATLIEGRGRGLASGESVRQIVREADGNQQKQSTDHGPA
jgi:hypothetical protein